MIYDVVIIWWWAAGLFTGICLDKKIKKIVLEKNAKPGIKVLLSGWERANVSNMDIEPMRDYFTQNKKFLLSIFAKYSNWDIMSFFAENNVNIVEEDRSRLILESWDSKELLACLLDNLQKNKCELWNWDWVENIIPRENNQLTGEWKNTLKYLEWDSPDGDWKYKVVTTAGKKYFTKNVVMSAWGKSFSHVWTTGDWYNMAEKLWVKMTPTHPCLCGISTKTDLKEISGVSAKVSMKFIDKSNNKVIYSEVWPILFTHFWVSGPIIHNVSVVAWEYLNGLNIPESDYEKYFCDNFALELDIPLENATKSMIKFFDLHPENTFVNIDLHSFRSLKEAKATSGWIDTNELDNNMQSKKHKWLYFNGEVVDVTGKTWGFNLQWAWSSAFVTAEHINKQFIIKPKKDS